MEIISAQKTLATPTPHNDTRSYRTTTHENKNVLLYNKGRITSPSKVIGAFSMGCLAPVEPMLKRPCITNFRIFFFGYIIIVSFIVQSRAQSFSKQN